MTDERSLTRKVINLLLNRISVNIMNSIGDAERPDGTKSTVLYELLNRSLKQAPIIIEVQRAVDYNFMLRVLHYGVMAHRRYSNSPNITGIHCGECINLTENMPISNINDNYFQLRHKPCEQILREQQLLNGIKCACDVGVKHYQKILETPERLPPVFKVKLNLEYQS
ncbi:hypothetical protein BDC45DRAFT_602715 [Circinella umbellata]|nr:hypothetical protein BDC45DRAFT_602715 [Circinella umbellata]